MTTVLTFLKEVRIELARVAWPTRRQLIVYTGVVVGLSLALAAFLGALDTFFAFLLRIIIN